MLAFSVSCGIAKRRKPNRNRQAKTDCGNIKNEGNHRIWDNVDREEIYSINIYNGPKQTEDVRPWRVSTN